MGLLTRIIADAAAEGLIQRHQPTDESADAEPLADWERELLEQGAAAEVAEAVEPRPSSRLRPPRASRLVEVDVAEVVDRGRRRLVEVEAAPRSTSSRPTAEADAAEADAK